MEVDKEQTKRLGGARAGAGRKSVAHEQKVNEIFLSALKSINDVETDLEAKQHFAIDLLSFERGKMFVAEHLFGKPKETVETNHTFNNFELKDVIKFKD